jgi:hypothetical protein
VALQALRLSLRVTTKRAKALRLASSISVYTEEKGQRMPNTPLTFRTALCVLQAEPEDGNEEG